MPNWGSVAVSYRTWDGPKAKWTRSWTMLLGHGLRNGDTVIVPSDHMPQHWAANAVFEVFLERDFCRHCDSLLMLDDDMVFAHDALERLRSNPAGHEFDVLSGLARGKRGRPLIITRGEAGEWIYTSQWERGAVLEVDAVGFAFTLIRRTALAAMTPPWAWWHTPTGGEDVGFCIQAKERGLRLAVDTGVSVGHVVERVLWTYPDEGEEEEGDR